MLGAIIGKIDDKPVARIKVKSLGESKESSLEKRLGELRENAKTLAEDQPPLLQLNDIIEIYFIAHLLKFSFVETEKPHFSLIISLIHPRS